MKKMVIGECHKNENNVQSVFQNVQKANTINQYNGRQLKPFEG